MFPAGIFLMQKKISFATAHLDGSHWQTMACGGRCEQCQMVDLQATLNSSRQLFGNLTVRDLIQPDEVRSVVPPPSRRPEADRAATPSSSSARPREGETEGSLVPLVQQLTSTVENLTKQLQDLQRQQEYRELVVAEVGRHNASIRGGHIHQTILHLDDQCHRRHQAILHRDDRVHLMVHLLHLQVVQTVICLTM